MWWDETRVAAWPEFSRCSTGALSPELSGPSRLCMNRHFLRHARLASPHTGADILAPSPPTLVRLGGSAQEGGTVPGVKDTSSGDGPSRTACPRTHTHECSTRDDGDNSEQMCEHWFGLRKPNAPLALSPTGCLCGLEEVTMVPGGGEERIGEKL